MTLKSQGKYDEAIQAYDKAIELDPNFSNAWSGKGDAFNLLGRTTEAEVAFAKVNRAGV
jgi:Flp pilus assembly protein TadD